MQSLHNKNKIYDYLLQGAAAITPNNRLADELLAQYFIQQAKATLPKPYCMPYGQALETAYQQLQYKTPHVSHPILFSSTLCQQLWRQIIKSTSHLSFSEGLLNTVMDAWSHCEQWQIPVLDLSFNHTKQTLQFQAWWQEFNSQLRQLNAITQYQLIDYFIAADLPLFPDTMVWICFDEFNPQQKALQHYLQQKGTNQFQYDLPPPQTKPQLFAASDINEEYQQLMTWLHHRMQAGDARIGVVVPNLQQEARKLQRILLNHFEPSDFHLYLGHTLAEFNLVSHAMSWLKIEQTLSTHEAALLLQSPYIAFTEDERLGRAQFLQESPLLRKHKISLSRFAHELKPYAPKLASLLNTLQSYPKEASVFEWIQCFQKRLNHLGFPGQRTLNSEIYQCLNRFLSIFDEFMQLHLISQKFNPLEALKALSSLLENTIFQAQQPKAIIQFSGLLEASGCEFDSLWVMGLTDDCLPKKPQLSAFICPHMQRQLQMPHSTLSREFFLAKQSLERLQATESFVFSYPQFSGDNPNLPCTLISDLTSFKALTLLPESKPCTVIPIEEAYKLPLKPEELRSAGTALLANQAKCPFKAFAEYRLQARPSADVEDGLSALERGQIIHKVMEDLWRQLGSQEALLACTDLDFVLDKVIFDCLNPLKQSHFISFTPLIEQIEFIRIKDLVLSCLEWEKQRPPFVVVGIEKSFLIELAGLSFQVRVDRLDDVGGNKWVIDYKSTLPSSKPWNEDRPKEPQLLLYALLDEQINTIFFMQLKAGKISFCGISEYEESIPGVSSLKKEESWSNRTNHWQNQLSDLAHEFQQGHCQPAPINASICQLCDFQTLCRFQKDSSG